jgi:hypothetical protein
MHTCNPSTQEAEADLQLKVSLYYSARPCLKNNKKKPEKNRKRNTQQMRKTEYTT